MKLIIATRNEGKLREFRQLLAGVNLEIVGAAEVAGCPEIVEDAATLEGNAVRKAVGVHAATGEWALADDSGVEVEALDGAPGVLSAVYAGPQRDPAANNRKLLAALSGIANRRARFRCVLALAGPSFPPQTVEGICEGVITSEPRGEHGFGYDPIFVPDGFAQTFAELPAEVKNQISHRARALQAALAVWGPVLRTAARAAAR
ncbi:MAG: RdgB/HAM1 family non-canonical purine NTP pyrophosphatase [Kiritimatiellae bacterium]|nr:RdgB/HAM1 family non-canonical purine NTP pyrophosphatase [Kiritimatiellia bacterium]